MQPAEEHADHQARWNAESHCYDLASTFIEAELQAYQGAHPTTVRVFFSRQPRIKPLNTITQKIQRLREKHEGYSYDDINDIIAFTILCPYPSDIQEVVSWLRRSFTVHTPDSDSFRSEEGGYRARHFVVSLRSDSARAHPALGSVKCEIQIKTVLQEAFEAKTHDLVYKPRGRAVDHSVAQQFAVLSDLLSAIDRQSELVKSLILYNDQQLVRRREASLILYFSQPEVVSLKQEFGVDFQRMDATEVSAILGRRALDGISREFCKFATLYALHYDDELLKSDALGYATKYCLAGPRDAGRYYVRAAMKWALNRPAEAIRDLQRTVDLAEAGLEDELIHKTMNSYIYFVADAKAFHGLERAEWVAQAHAYVSAVGDPSSDESLLDTIGFFYIVFGATAEDVEKGMHFLAAAASTRRDDEVYLRFFRLHQFVALQRLIELNSAVPSMTLD